MLVRLHNQVCAWILTEQELSWAPKLLKDMDCSLCTQSSGDKISHRQCHTVQECPLSLKDASEWAQLLKTYLLNFKPQSISVYLSCTSFKVSSSTIAPTVKKKKKKIPSLRYGRFLESEFIMLSRKKVWTIVSYSIIISPRKNKLPHEFNIFWVSVKVSSSYNVLWF